MPESPDQQTHLPIPPPLLPAPTHLLPSAAKHRPQQRRADWRIAVAAAASVVVAGGAFAVARDFGSAAGGRDSARGAFAIVDPESGDTRIGTPTVGPVGTPTGTDSTRSTDPSDPAVPPLSGTRGTTGAAARAAAPASTRAESPESTGNARRTGRPGAGPGASTPAQRPVPAEPEPKDSSQPTTDSAPPEASSASSVSARVIELTNAERERNGCPSVAESAQLAAAAQGHAEDMAARDYFSHTSPEGTTASERASAKGYSGSSTSENIAIGHDTAEEVVNAWMSSDEHRATILDCSRTAIGVGYDPGNVQSDSADGSWVQMFGSP